MFLHSRSPSLVQTIVLNVSLRGHPFIPLSFPFRVLFRRQVVVEIKLQGLGKLFYFRLVYILLPGV